MMLLVLFPIAALPVKSFLKFERINLYWLRKPSGKLSVIQDKIPILATTGTLSTTSVGKGL